jgi:hypothetical protein
MISEKKITLSPEEETAHKTRMVWYLFDKFSKWELYILLLQSGIQPGKTKKQRLAQVVIAWFDGFIPNRKEWKKLQGKKI